MPGTVGVGEQASRSGRASRQSSKVFLPPSRRSSPLSIVPRLFTVIERLSIWGLLHDIASFRLVFELRCSSPSLVRWKREEEWFPPNLRPTPLEHRYEEDRLQDRRVENNSMQVDLDGDERERKRERDRRFVEVCWKRFCVRSDFERVFKVMLVSVNYVENIIGTCNFL